MVDRPDVLDLLATNVVVITAVTQGQRHGCAANCWGEPAAGATALVTLARGGRPHRAVMDSGVFGVSVLAADQAAAARRFAQKELEPGGRFASIETVDLADVPVLADCLASFVCNVASSHTFGEYETVFGDVRTSRFGRSADPLLYFDGTFGQIQPIIRARTDEDERR